MTGSRPSSDRVELPGSNRPLATTARLLDERPPADERIDVTVTIRGGDLPDDVTTPMSRAELEQRFGASPADADTVRAALEQEGLDVVDVSLPTRSIRVRGTLRQFENAFGVDFVQYETADRGTFRGRRGTLSVPASIADIVTGIFGLDDRRVARRKAAAAAGTTRPTPLTPGDIEQRYAFPPGDAAGQVVAIAEFGGAYFPQDTAAYCQKFGRPEPQVTPISAGFPLLTLDEIRQLPEKQQKLILEESVEVMMDVEIIAGLCPGATLPLYFAPFTEKGWVELLNAVIMSDPTPVALSISWGLAEDSPDWSAAALKAVNNRLHAAAALGITVCVASGDDGAGDQIFDGKAHVNFPASSPWVLAVGGTQLDGADEVVWWQAPGDRAHNGGSTGGGVSTVWPRPAWQDVHVTSLNPGAIDGRVVPDVAAIAGPPMYDLVCFGQDSPNGGTSAATPVWAALLARVAAGLPAADQRRFLAPLLYAAGSGGSPVGSTTCTDITSGGNSSTGRDPGYLAGPGYDAVTGWGTPRGTALQQALAGSAQAATPGAP